MPGIEGMIPLSGRQADIPGPLEGYVRLLGAQQQQQQMEMQRQMGQAALEDRQAQTAQRQTDIDQKQRLQRSQQAIDDLMSNSMVQDANGVYSFDRPTFEKGLIQGGQGHLYPQLSETLDKLEQSQARINTERNQSIARAVYAVQQAGNTTGAVQTAAAFLKKNRLIDDEHLQPVLDAIHQDEAPENIGRVMQALGQGMPEYQKLVSDDEKRKTDLRKTNADAGKVEAETSNLYTYGRPTAPEPPSLQSKDVVINGKPATVNFNPRTGTYEPVQGVSPIPPRPPAPAATSGDAQDVKDTAGGIMSGLLPPELPSRGSRTYTALAGELSRNKYDLTKANEDWLAQKKYMATINGAQQVRLRQAVAFTKDSLDKVEELAKEWDGGKFPPLNAAMLATAKKGLLGEQAASIATRLEAQIADLVSELGTVYKGGNSSTDESLSLAAKNLSANWSKKVLLDNVTLARQNLQIRQNSMKQVAAVTSGSATASSVQEAPAGGVSVRAPNGKSYSFKSQADADGFKAKAGIR